MFQAPLSQFILNSLHLISFLDLPKMFSLVNLDLSENSISDVSKTFLQI